MRKNIIVGRIYHLDLGASVPVTIKVLNYQDNNNILVLYLNSWPDRVETLSIDCFK